jgi:hypothetical protein
VVLPNKVYLKGYYFEKKVHLDLFTILVYPYKQDKYSIIYRITSVLEGFLQQYWVIIV